MRPLTLVFFATIVCCLASIATAAVQREEAVTLPNGSRVSIAVPAGFKFEQARDAGGAPRAVLNAAEGKASLELSFLPDPDGKALRLRGRNELMVEFFQEYVAGSVEKAMEFTELSPRRGAGTLCVFTDAALVGKTDLPPNEYHHLTVGIKAWEGVMVVFRLFSQDAKSETHLAALRVLRESVEERPVPLR
ncbi:MAG: hypothetical protein RJB55_2778 [Verrucomicrobiota bacterium]|jgi:hypothetical protein